MEDDWDVKGWPNFWEEHLTGTEYINNELDLLVFMDRICAKCNIDWATYFASEGWNYS